ncbi:MAG TPA: COX15/CtaA family protein [Cyclobacteriaceae bacterium]|nr:COX15/CtaA family protein [Cyclobacteriaceae bacterium]
MRTFYKLSRSTLVAVYLLILVGGVVRSTGSGMGCPDWPRCFGQWVPPTSVEQLPENYKEVYAAHRHEKNIKFAKYLKALGFNETADKILTDPSVKEEADFNPVKTSIEYVNRLVGVTIGFLIFAVFVYSWRYRKVKVSITLVAFLCFVLVGFQGWIGSVVVSTNLTPWVITLHMFLAMVIVAMLAWLVHRARTPQETVHAVKRPPAFTRYLLVACMVVLLVQILLGTRVREAVDIVTTEISAREEWIAALGSDFIIHRSFSWAVVILYTVLAVKLWKMQRTNRFVLSLIMLILGTIFTGLGMAWFAIPPFLQPVHLTLATVTFGVQFMLLLRVNEKLNVATH